MVWNYTCLLQTGENYMWMGNVQQITRFEVLVNQYGLIDPAQPLFKMATVNA